MTYDQAIARLDEIVQELENGQAVSMEQYLTLANEAKKLITQCREHLTTLDTQIKDVLK